MRMNRYWIVDSHADMPLTTYCLPSPESTCMDTGQYNMEQELLQSTNKNIVHLVYTSSLSYKYTV